jgi:hypothetical protein
MSFEISGKLIEKYNTHQVTERFTKREFVLEKREIAGMGEYVETIKFQLTQDRCDLIENIQIGDDIKINFNIRGRRWEKDGQVNYFNNLEAWKIEKQAVTAGQPEIPPPSADDIPPEEPTDDLPF